METGASDALVPMETIKNSSNSGPGEDEKAPQAVTLSFLRGSGSNSIWGLMVGTGRPTQERHRMKLLNSRILVARTQSP